MLNKKKKKWKPQRPPKVPKLAKPAKADRPKVGELRDIYKGLVTSDFNQLDSALRHAMHWFENTEGYVNYKTEGVLSDQQGSWLGSALELWKRARNSKGKAKIEAYKAAIQHYEKLLRSVKVKVPLLEGFLVTDKRKDELAREEDDLTTKYLTVLTVMKQSMQPLNAQGLPVELRVGTIKAPYILDPESQVVPFRKDVVTQLYRVYRKRGLLPLFYEVSEPLSRLPALEKQYNLDRSPTGKTILDPVKQIKALYCLMRNLIEYASTEQAPKRLVKSQIIHIPGAERKPRKGGFGVKRDLLMGHFMVGSTMGRLVKLMLDYNWHPKEEMAQAVLPADIDGKIKSLIRRGLKYELWTVENKGSQYKLVKMESK